VGFLTQPGFLRGIHRGVFINQVVALTLRRFCLSVFWIINRRTGFRSSEAHRNVHYRCRRHDRQPGPETNVEGLAN